MLVREYLKLHIKPEYQKKALVLASSKKVADVRLQRLKNSDKIPEDHNIFIRIP